MLHGVREAGGAPEGVSLLRVLDVILWMRHHDEHQFSGCAGLAG